MHLPACFASLILTFAPVFVQQRTWRRAELLLIGAILAPGKRTVTSLLRIAGLGRERRFTNYHRVLNRAAWDARAAARLLLGLLIAVFAPSGPVLLGIDDTIERRRGKRIAAKGIYRDPVRSSKGHLVKASGLRWLSLMLPAPIPWAGRVWALPFLTADSDDVGRAFRTEVGHLFRPKSAGRSDRCRPGWRVARRSVVISPWRCRSGQAAMAWAAFLRRESPRS